MVSATLWLPLDHATGPQVRSLEGLHRAHVVETVSEA